MSASNVQRASRANRCFRIYQADDYITWIADDRISNSSADGTNVFLFAVQRQSVEGFDPSFAAWWGQLAPPPERVRPLNDV